METKYKIPADISAKLKKLENLGFVLGPEYICFLSEFNVVEFGGEYSIKMAKSNLPIEFLFGFSKKKDEDLISINKMYKNRIPDDHIAIGSVNYGDLICMPPNGGVFHWDHEVHDLYFNNDGNGYRPQNIKLESIANSFHEFKELIVQTDIIVDDQEIDDALNPETPFSDSSLDFDFKNPKLFFLSPKNSIDIHLKKLTLSERGRQLIEKFKQEGLM